VCAVDASNDTVGDSITLAEFSALPCLATACGHEVSPAEAQLDALRIARTTEITTAFGLAPLLLWGTHRIALIHGRLTRFLADQTSLRLLEPPMPLQPIHPADAVGQPLRARPGAPVAPAAHRRLRRGS